MPFRPNYIFSMSDKTTKANLNCRGKNTDVDNRILRYVALINCIQIFKPMLFYLTRRTPTPRILSRIARVKLTTHASLETFMNIRKDKLSVESRGMCQTHPVKRQPLANNLLAKCAAMILMYKCATTRVNVKCTTIMMASMHKILLSIRRDSNMNGKRRDNNCVGDSGDDDY